MKHPLRYLLFPLLILTACGKKIPDPLLGRWKCVRVVESYSYNTGAYATTYTTVSEKSIDKTYVLEFKSRRSFQTFANDDQRLDTKASAETTSEGYKVDYGKTKKDREAQSFSIKMVGDTMLINGFFPFDNSGQTTTGSGSSSSYAYANYFVKQ